MFIKIRPSLIINIILFDFKLRTIYLKPLNVFIVTHQVHEQPRL